MHIANRDCGQALILAKFFPCKQNEKKFYEGIINKINMYNNIEVWHLKKTPK